VLLPPSCSPAYKNKGAKLLCRRVGSRRLRQEWVIASARLIRGEITGTKPANDNII